ncbi:lithostathine-1-beta-like [Saccostrea cucullata]|uniref:lithostathine-1-beta-like n=1 Tax=Saccostrea cuccullata TaxID=36930 RepID=UPI002ED639D1
MSKKWLFFLIISVLTTFANTKRVCESGWIPYGDHCYYFSMTSATLKDAVVNKMLWNEFNFSGTECSCRAKMNDRPGCSKSIKNLWICVTDLLQNHSFVYISNGYNVQEDDNNWDKGQPDPDNTEHCVALPAGYKGWHDYPCDSMFHFVCKRRKI